MTGVGARGHRRSAASQEVEDPGHACNYSRIPHLLLDDAAAGRLLPSSIVLYLHYQRVAFELHGRPMAESLRETKRRTGLSNGTILAARAQLVAAGWVTVQDQGEGEAALVTLVERWGENCVHARGGQILTTPGQKLTAGGQKPATSGRKLTAGDLTNGSFKTGEDTEDPPTPKGAQGVDEEWSRTAVLKPDDSFQPALPRTAAVGLSAPGYRDPGEELLAAFYRGLASDLASLTSRQRQSKLKLARELAGVGATPAQAEAYARETNADPRRTAPVTLRAFAEERQAWLQRRGRSEASGPRLVDRTGQLGSWSTASPAERVAGDRLGTTAGAMARAIVGGAS